MDHSNSSHVEVFLFRIPGNFPLDVGERLFRDVCKEAIYSIT
ncbi:hypothetical protein [Methanosarcina siciliae]|nr:hypothetical protein [Methanosarcina siciliae]